MRFRSICTRRFTSFVTILTLFALAVLPCPAEEQIKLAYSTQELPGAAPFPDEPIMEIGPVKTAEPKPVVPCEEALLEWARTDHIQLIKAAMAHYKENIQNYTATFYKHERIKGDLKPRQTIAVDFKENPYSLRMIWQENSMGCDKLIYVEGEHDNKMVVHPTGFFSWIKSVKRDPFCKDARKSTRKPCNHFGFYRTMQSLLSTYEEAHKKDDLTIKFIGRTKIDGHDCITLERHLPAKEGYPCARLVIQFDIERLIPVSLTSYDKDGKLISLYKYDDIKLNTDVNEKTFCLKANRM